MIKEVLHKKGIPTERLYGLGTDGAAVMTGMCKPDTESRSECEIVTSCNYLAFIFILRLNGVAKQLQDNFPWLLPVACIATI